MDGIIVINKPSGYTSHDIVSKIRKKLRNVVLTNIKGGAIIVNVRGKQSSHL
mgnify:CR=1 FL=1